MSKVKKIIRLVQAMLICFLLSVISTNAVVINQVYFDPVNTESGGEAIELYNPDEYAVNISGYVIRSESSNADATVPDSVVMGVGEYYLIADVGWSENKDNAMWPDADYEEALNLYNSDSGIALVFNDTIIDAVGYGDAIEIENMLFEGSPISVYTEGDSITRVNFSDTNNNFNDFVSMAPFFHNSLFQDEMLDNEVVLSFTVNVVNSMPDVKSWRILTDDDLDDPGIQVLPSPGQKKNITMEIVVRDPDGLDDISFVSIEVTGPNFSKKFVFRDGMVIGDDLIFTIDIGLDYFDASGTYELFMDVVDFAGESYFGEKTIDYLEMIAFDLDSDSLVFDEVRVGNSVDINGDTDFNTTTLPTIMNLGNVDLDFSLYSENLGNFSGMKYGLGDENKFVSILESPNLFGGSLVHGKYSFLPLNFRLSLNESFAVGSYGGTINVMGVKA